MRCLTLKFQFFLKPSGILSLAARIPLLMAHMMGNVLGSEKSKSTKHAITASTLQTPPRTPTLTATSAQTLASEIRGIHHALSGLPDLAPGDKVNTLLTRLVNLCIVPYSHDFVAYFFGIDGIQILCEQLRPLCAMAEGELERYWAKKMVEESRSMNGKHHNSMHPYQTHLQSCECCCFEHR